MRIYPSLASGDVLRLAEQMDRLGDWKWLHFDVEDGNFTPNMTFGQKTLRAVSGYWAPKCLDVHLMVTDPMAWLPHLKACGVRSVCAHIEALRFPLLFLNTAKDMGMRAGLALNIATPLEAVRPFLDDMDTLLLMTAEPDGKGERLNKYALDRAVKAAEECPVPVMADGALDEKAVKALGDAGAFGCVLGRLIFSSGDPGAALNKYGEAGGCD